MFNTIYTQHYTSPFQRLSWNVRDKRDMQNYKYLLAILSNFPTYILQVFGEQCWSVGFNAYYIHMQMH